MMNQPYYTPIRQNYGGYQPPQYDPPQYQPQQYQQQPQAPTYRCCPVTSREEATAMQSDFFGPGTLMPDMGHGMVYFKRFNQQSGASDFYEFALVQPQEQAKAADPSAIWQMFGERLDDMAAKIDGLYDRLDGKPKKGAAKDE